MNVENVTFVQAFVVHIVIVKLIAIEIVAKTSSASTVQDSVVLTVVVTFLNLFAKNVNGLAVCHVLKKSLKGSLLVVECANHFTVTNVLLIELLNV